VPGATARCRAPQPRHHALSGANAVPALDSAGEGGPVTGNPTIKILIENAPAGTAEHQQQQHDGRQPVFPAHPHEFPEFFEE
jgi:hypothetical protein